MKTFEAFLKDNILLNTTFLILAVLGIIVSILLFRLSVKKRKPSYKMRSFNLISKDIKEKEFIEIKYKGDVVDDLTVTKISFWNHGSEVIDKNDIAPKDPLRIVPNNSIKILDVVVTYIHNQANNLSFQLLEDNIIYVDFDYLGNNDGFVVQIYHVGNSEENFKLNVTFKTAEKLLGRNTSSDSLIMSRIYEYIFTKLKLGELSGFQFFLATLIMMPILFPLRMIVLIIEILMLPTNTIKKEYLLDD